MNRLKLTASTLAVGMSMFAGGAIAHDTDPINSAGTPVCVEANYMVADAEFAPASPATKAGTGHRAEHHYR